MNPIVNVGVKKGLVPVLKKGAVPAAIWVWNHKKEVKDAFDDLRRKVEDRRRKIKEDKHPAEQLRRGQEEARRIELKRRRDAQRHENKLADIARKEEARVREAERKEADRRSKETTDARLKEIKRNGKGAAPVIQFFEIDSDKSDDIPVGTVTIDGSGKLAASDPDLLVLAEAAGGSVAEVIEALSGWSNGYLRSKRVA